MVARPYGGQDDEDPPARAGLGRRLWFLWGAGTASAVGNGLYYVALPLQAQRLTHQPLVVAGVLFAERLPWLLIGIPAGAYADRVDRLRLMRRMDLLRGAVLVAVAALVAADHISIGLLYVAALVVGGCDTLFAGSIQATVPALVGRADLGRANGMLAVGSTAGEQTVGPALGGVLYSLGRSIPFAADAVSFFASAGLLLGVRRAPSRDQRPARAGLAVVAAEVGRNTRGGIAWYRSHAGLRLMTATVAGLAFSQAMVSGIMVLFVLYRLHLSVIGFGLFMAGVALGNVAGGVVAARLLRRVPTPTVVVAVAVLAGVGYLGAGPSTSPALAGAFLGLEAVAVTVGNVATVSYRQRVTPAEMQARVANLWRTVVWGVVPLGVLAGGGLGSAFGLRVPFYVAGGLQLLLALIVVRPLHRLADPA